jgi:hypothetical protein
MRHKLFAALFISLIVATSSFRNIMRSFRLISSVSKAFPSQLSYQFRLSMSTLSSNELSNMKSSTPDQIREFELLGLKPAFTEALNSLG